MKHALLALLLATASLAQTFHVTSTHDGSVSEQTYRTSVQHHIIEGVICDRKYKLSDVAVGGSYHFDVGSDYPVVSIGRDRIKLLVPGKKGPRNYTLDIEGTEEVK